MRPIMLWDDDGPRTGPSNGAANINMDQAEKLLELYKETKTPSERRVLLETVRISNPADFSRLEEMILRDQVRAMTLEQLVQRIARHRNLSIGQAEELLRDTVLQNLLDRAKLNVEQISPSSPADKSSPCVAAIEPIPGRPETVPPGARETAPSAAEGEKSDHGTVEVIILQDSSQGEKTPTIVGNVPEADQNGTSFAPPAAASVTPLPKLAPRGIGG